ncbi:MAG: T9SS type A sorting domain-containing protein [bacterium]|nr:T9SS type A sorting domain-containing protein [bacterium]
MIIFYFLALNLWSQTNWSGGSGQLLWSDTTKFFNKKNVNYSRLPGSILLEAPYGWQNTGQLEGAQNIWALAKTYDNVLYAGGDSAALKGFVFKTTDYGNNWTDMEVPSCNWVHSLLIQDTVLYAGTDVGVFKYTTSWSSTNLTKSVNALLIAKNGTFYAGTGDGEIYKSSDGSVWTAVTVNNGTRIWKIVEDSENNLYAGGSRVVKKDTISGVFKSTDGLVFDTTMFPHIDKVVYSLAMCDSIIYAGTGPDLGKVFKSSNKGVSWDTTQTLSYTYFVYSLLKGDNNVIYAGVGNQGGYLYKSVNGTSWTSEQIDVQISSIYSIIQTKNGFLYLGSNAGMAGDGRVSRAGYFTSGSFRSSVFIADSGNNIDYGQVIWDASLNTGTMEVWVRTNTKEDMYEVGVDSVRIMNSGDTIPDSFNNKGYIQYQVKFATPTSDLTPILNSIEIEFTPKIGIEEKSNIKNQILKIEAYPNPFVENAVISYSASGGFRSAQQEKDKETEIRIYDISGRTVYKVDKLNKSSKSLVWSPKTCPAGIYFVEVKSADYKLIKKLVKIK